MAGCGKGKNSIELENILSQIALADNHFSFAIMDGIVYTIEINSKERAVDLEKAPGKYVDIVARLKKNLKRVKSLSSFNIP